jgi:hypothetical protein
LDIIPAGKTTLRIGLGASRGGVNWVLPADTVVALPDNPASLSVSFDIATGYATVTRTGRDGDGGVASTLRASSASTGLSADYSFGVAANPEPQADALFWATATVEIS